MSVALPHHDVPTVHVGGAGIRWHYQREFADFICHVTSGFDFCRLKLFNFHSRIYGALPEVLDGRTPHYWS